MMETFPILEVEITDGIFPEGFLWGAGGSGMQHEGSPLADGASPSAMYRWAHAAPPDPDVEPSWTTQPLHTFDVSADFYRRFGSDIELMREMNLNASNFEVYWPRIVPDGTGSVNERALAFYDRLVDAFLAAGITPLCNLYVFDHPAALEDHGGWQNRDMARWFADYAAVVFERLGDRVPYWSTICEIPLVGLFTSGVVTGVPGDDMRATHHVLLGQGLAVQAFRASGAKGQIGNQHNFSLITPASDSEQDVAAAERLHTSSNLLYLDSQLRGEYPDALIDGSSDAIADGDLATISEPIDYLGINYAYGQTVAHDPSEDDPLRAKVVAHSTDCVRDALVAVRDSYGDIPILILEAGHGDRDEKVVDGRVEDTPRLVILREHLAAVQGAISDGVDVRGYFVWSFLDGWEFGYGLSLRYGIVHVDFETQERIVKDSGRWYGAVAGANSLVVPA